MNSISKIFRILSDNIKYFIFFDIAFYMFLVIYDFTVYKRPYIEVLTSYISLIIIDAFAFFGAYFVIWIQLKNSISTTKFLNYLSILFSIGFTLMFIALSIEYLFNGFLIATFITPILFLGFLFAQRTRFEKYNK